MKDDQCNTSNSKISCYLLITHQSYSDPLEKTSHPLGNCLLLEPHSPQNFRCPLWWGGVGWGMGEWIVSGTTHFLLFTLQGNETANGGADNSLCADNIQIPASSSITYSCRPKVYGRYLYIRIPGKNKVLTLCEVEVYSLSKTVNFSSCLFCRYAWCLCAYLFFAFY